MTPRKKKVPREHGRRKSDAIKTTLAWSGVVAVLISAVVGYVAISTVGDVRREERESIDLVRRAAWRLCSRDMRDRALAHALLEGRPRMLAEIQNPIVDCDPNLKGRPAYALTPAGQRAFVDRWLHGELDPLPEPPGRKPGLDR